MMLNQDLGAKVWGGNPRALKEVVAGTPYDSTDACAVLCRAMLLYSFRAGFMDGALYRNALIAMREDLQRKQRIIESPDSDQIFGSHWADRVDMLSTYYRWYSTQPNLPRGERDHFALLAMSLCWNALSKLGPERGSNPGRAHTYYLIQTTRIWLDSPSGDHHMTALDRIAKEVNATAVSNAHQRARIYCRLGILYNQVSANGHLTPWARGIWWGTKAIFVPGISLNKRLKCLGAFIGCKD